MSTPSLYDLFSGNAIQKPSVDGEGEKPAAGGAAIAAANPLANNLTHNGIWKKLSAPTLSSSSTSTTGPSGLHYGWNDEEASEADAAAARMLAGALGDDTDGIGGGAVGPWMKLFRSRSVDFESSFFPANVIDALHPTPAASRSKGSDPSAAWNDGTLSPMLAPGSGRNSRRPSNASNAAVGSGAPASSSKPSSPWTSPRLGPAKSPLLSAYPSPPALDDYVRASLTVERTPSASSAMSSSGLRNAIVNVDVGAGAVSAQMTPGFAGMTSITDQPPALTLALPSPAFLFPKGHSFAAHGSSNAPEVDSDSLHSPTPSSSSVAPSSISLASTLVAHAPMPIVMPYPTTEQIAHPDRNFADLDSMISDIVKRMLYRDDYANNDTCSR
ncbi:hypothetical protein HK101_009282, partial [Irineochytrium annulatum]